MVDSDLEGGRSLEAWGEKWKEEGKRLYVNSKELSLN